MLHSQHPLLTLHCACYVRNTSLHIHITLSVDNSVVMVIETSVETAFVGNIEFYRNHSFNLSIDGFSFQFWNSAALKS